MTREQIEKAAAEFFIDYEEDIVTSCPLEDFAIQQVNAALEEAAKVCQDDRISAWGQGKKFRRAIRALKVS